MKPQVIALIVASALFSASPSWGYIHEEWITHPDGTREIRRGQITSGEILAAGGVILVKLLFDPPGPQFTNITPPAGWTATTQTAGLPFNDPALTDGNFVAFISPGPLSTPQEIGDYSFATQHCDTELKIQYRRKDTGAIVEQGPVSQFGTIQGAMSACAADGPLVSPTVATILALVLALTGSMVIRRRAVRG